MKSAQWAADLKAVAEIVKDSDCEMVGQIFNIWVANKTDMVAQARAIGGDWEKVVGGNFFSLRKKVGGHKIDIFASRDRVCERVVTTEEVEVTERDAKAVSEAVASIPLVTKTVTREVVEWVCPDSLLAEDRDAWYGTTARDPEAANG